MQDQKQVQGNGQDSGRPCLFRVLFYREEYVQEQMAAVRRAMDNARAGRIEESVGCEVALEKMHQVIDVLRLGLGKLAYEYLLQCKGGDGGRSFLGRDAAGLDLATDHQLVARLALENGEDCLAVLTRKQGA